MAPPRRSASSLDKRPRKLLRWSNHGIALRAASITTESSRKVGAKHDSVQSVALTPRSSPQAPLRTRQQRRLLPQSRLKEAGELILVQAQDEIKNDEIVSTPEQRAEPMKTKVAILTVNLDFDLESFSALRANTAIERHVQQEVPAELTPIMQLKLCQMQEFAARHLPANRPKTETVLQMNLLGAIVALATNFGLKSQADTTIADAAGLLRDPFIIATGSQSVPSYACTADWTRSSSIDMLARARLGSDVLRGYNLLEVEYKILFSRL